MFGPIVGWRPVGAAWDIQYFSRWCMQFGVFTIVANGGRSLGYLLLWRMVDAAWDIDYLWRMVRAGSLGYVSLQRMVQAALLQRWRFADGLVGLLCLCWDALRDSVLGCDRVYVVPPATVTTYIHRTPVPDTQVCMSANMAKHGTASRLHTSPCGATGSTRLEPTTPTRSRNRRLTGVFISTLTAITTYYHRTMLPAFIR